MIEYNQCQNNNYFIKNYIMIWNAVDIVQKNGKKKYFCEKIQKLNWRRQDMTIECRINFN